MILQRVAHFMPGFHGPCYWSPSGNKIKQKYQEASAGGAIREEVFINASGVASSPAHGDFLENLSQPPVIDLNTHECESRKGINDLTTGTRRPLVNYMDLK